jgi:hypothetical protein
MRGIPAANGASPAAIFTRLWENKDGQLPRAIARHVLKVRFSDQDQERMHELCIKNQEGHISPAELAELDSLITAGDILALLQSKARMTLRRKTAGSNRHG